MKAAKLILPALLIAGFITPALAETAKTADTPKPRMERHHPADADKDGVLSRAEYDAYHDARFLEMDLDRDGKVTEEEMRKFMETRREAMKERWDGRRGEGRMHKNHMRGERMRGETAPNK